MIIKEIFSKFKDNSRTNCTFLEFQEFLRTKVIFKDFSRSVRTLSLESPHRGNSNEYTQFTIFNIRKKITIYYVKSADMGFFQGTQ